MCVPEPLIEPKTAYRNIGSLDDNWQRLFLVDLYMQRLLRQTGTNLNLCTKL